MKKTYHGGITLVQKPSSAKYENMPQSAIDTGYVDFVLPASIIGSELLHILSDPESYQLEHLDVDDEADNTSVTKVSGLLTTRMGTDSMRNKPSAIHRRLEIKEPVTDPRIIELEHELAATKEHINTLVQELKTSNEELRALNEELQASNEELETAYDEIKAKKAEIEQVLEEQQDVINETGAKIYVKNNFPSKIVYIRGYLESILRNLISNSLKYRKKNLQPEIYLSVLPQGGFVFISVKDNGIGINLKTHDKKMFTPFNRFSEDTLGLGIGLYIIKTMVEKNGGSITAESEKGKGATFNIFLKEFQQG